MGCNVEELWRTFLFCNRNNKFLYRSAHFLCRYSLRSPRHGGFWGITLYKWTSQIVWRTYRSRNWMSKARPLFWLQRSKFHLCVCIVYCLPSEDYGHKPLPIVMQFGISALGTKVERCICKAFLFSTRFKMAVILWLFFSYSKTPWSIALKFGLFKYFYKHIKYLRTWFNYLT